MTSVYRHNRPRYGESKNSSECRTPIAQQSSNIDQFTDLRSLECPGIKQIFNHTSSCFRRFCWILILLLAVFTCSYQIYTRVDAFVNKIPAVVVEYEIRDSFNAPRITICPEIPSRNPKLRMLVKTFFDVDNKTDWNNYFFKLIEKRRIEDIWKESDLLHNGLNLEIIEGFSLINKQRKDLKNLYSIKIASPSGECHRVYSRSVVRYKGIYTFFHINSPYTKNREICKANARIQIENDDLNSYGHYLGSKFAINIELCNHVWMNILLREISYVNIEDKPCTDVSEYNKCIEKYIDDYFYKIEKSSCRLPYMNSSNGIRLCENPEEFQKVYETTEKLINTLLKEKCIRPCKHNSYYVKFFTSEPVKNGSMLDLEVNFLENRVEKISEYISYTSAALLSDIGGSLGLYLGISAILVLEFLEIVVITFMKIFYNCFNQLKSTQK